MSDIADMELRRLAALTDYRILDTPPEASFDRITRLAKIVLHAPMAQISFIDRNRQWLKACEDGLPRDTPRTESFCSHTVKSDAALVVPDARADARFSILHQVRGAPYVRAYIGIPLRTRTGMNIGALGVLDTVVRHPSAEEIAALADLAQVVMDELELRRAAIDDSLTGVLSSRAVLELAETDIAGALRNESDLSCITLDIDYFKAINDSYGHAAGDHALHALAQLLKSGIGSGNYVGRVGGDEFAIILPGGRRADAAALAERLRAQVMDTTLNGPAGPIHLTVSLGVATLRRGDGGVDDLLRRADEALYAAKAAGRNRLVSAERTVLKLVVR